MSAKRTGKKAQVKPGIRLPGAPKVTRPAWELSDRDRAAFLEHVDRTIARLPTVGTLHDEDRDLLRESLAAALAFHDLSKLIDALGFEDGMEDVASELEQIRIGVALGMKALHTALGERATGLESAKQHAMDRWAKDPRTPAREQIIAELERLHARGVVDVPQFALKMHVRHGNVYTSERSIERIARDWIRKHNAAL